MNSNKSSKIGFGGWGIGGDSDGLLSYGSINELVAIGAIEAAISRGINFFDTSPAYGGGNSEQLIGKVCRKERKKIRYATKVGLVKLGKEKNFELEDVKKSLESSFNRLQTDYIDLIQLHDPEVKDTVEIESIINYLNQCKNSGNVKAIGISLKNPEDFEYWSKISHFEYFQLNFNALDQRILNTGLPDYCINHNSKVIARTTLCFGFLSDNPPIREELQHSDHRLRWSRKQFTQWNKAADEIFRNLNDVSRTELALRFCLYFPWIEIVLTGIMSADEAIKNAIIGEMGALSFAEIEQIKQNYKLATQLLPLG